MAFRKVVPILAVLLTGVTLMATQTGSAGSTKPFRDLWLSQAELDSLPTSGPAWEGLLEVANGRFDTPDIADNQSDHDTQTFAAALASARTGDAALRQKAIEGIDAAMGTENGGNALALSRNLVAYVLAADLIDLPSASPEVDGRFRSWLEQVRKKDLDGRTLISTHDDRPNNWGTHAGASRIATALYLGDAADVNAAAQTFRGLLGDRNAYDDFRYGDLHWQADTSRPVGINPVGATINGHSVDGVLPDDQRRGGSFEWPPPCENYVREAMQGMIVQAELLRRQGMNAYEWSDNALLRAATWFTETAGCEFEGDDEWLTPLLNSAYGTSFPVETPVRAGKHLGFTDWTHDTAAERPPIVVTVVTTDAPAVSTTEQAPAESTTETTVTTPTSAPGKATTTSQSPRQTTTSAAPKPAPAPEPQLRRDSACTIIGTHGDDVLTGTSGDDIICGLGGDDRIDAGRGNDIVFAGDGNDTVIGGRGRDILHGEAGDDHIDGGRSNDYIDGGDGDDRLIGGSARDTIVGGNGNDDISAGSGDDIVMAGPGNDSLEGEDGDDFLDSGDGNDTVSGGDDDNTCANPAGVGSC